MTLETVLIPISPGAEGVSRTKRDTLVAVNDVPLLQFALTEAVTAGASRIVLVTEGADTAVSRFLKRSHPGRTSDGDGENFFTARSRPGVPADVDIVIVPRTEPLGFAGALIDSREHLSGGRIGILRVEDLLMSGRCLNEMAHTPLDDLNATLVGAVRAGDSTDGPTLSDGAGGRKLRPIGRFIIPHALPEVLADQTPDETGRRDLGRAISALGRLTAWPIEERCFDCSTREGLFEASQAVRSRRRTTRPVSAPLPI